MKLLDLIMRGADVILARAPEIYASVKHLEFEAKRNNVVLNRDIYALSPTNGIKCMTGKSAGEELKAPDGTSITEPTMAFRMIYDQAFEQPVTGIFVIPTFSCLSIPGTTTPNPAVLTALSYIRAIYGERVPGVTIILEASYSENVPQDIISSALSVKIPVPDKYETALLMDDVLASLNKNKTNSIVLGHPGASVGLNRKELLIAELVCQTPEDLHEMKRSKLNNSEVLQLHEYTEVDSFDYIVGLEALKTFVRKTARLDESRGVLLVGIPGTGKSAFSRALGKELGIPTITFYMDRVFNRFVGESEARMKAAIETLDAVGDCVVFIDEIEKSVGGMASSNMTDGGTGSRTFSQFLKWLSDRKNGSYVVATSNNINALPPEFIRAERWDSIFFIDMPSDEEAMRIAELWFDYFKVTHKPDKKVIRDMTGAEIRNLARLSRAFDTLQEAEKYVIRISRAREDQIRHMREWARLWACSAQSGAVKQEKRKIGFKV